MNRNILRFIVDVAKIVLFYYGDILKTLFLTKIDDAEIIQSTLKTIEAWKNRWLKKLFPTFRI